ncbi:hypothetical protein C8J25_103362 [Sphingomonas faeni]|uniref:Uncharacterized protein n=1 Tax=Sphingomonas faeni TaxID=185950 RepID=A0A2T5U816_9SPHN|nr:hypothetical protein [Sphingomonas faeni]PTW47641.1 hypothetical protein C8J25_103362 [Sphingomonas faeni]
MPKSTDDLINDIKQAKAHRDAEQLKKNDEVAFALQKERAELIWATDDWDKARNLLDIVVDDVNRKLADANMELVFAQTDETPGSGNLKHWLMHFTNTSQGLRERVQVQIVPSISGTLNAVFQVENDHAFEERKFQTSKFTSEQADLIINRMLERATS